MSAEIDTKLFEESVNYFPQLLRFFKEVANSIPAKSKTDIRANGCKILAKKIYYHASSMYHLSLGTPIYGENEKAYIRDFASMIVISRAILETYLVLFEVYVEPKSLEELDYRDAVYSLKGFSIRETFVPNYKFVKRYEKVIQDIDVMRDRIKNTVRFNSFKDKNHKTQSLRGNIMPKRELGEKMRSAGFGPKNQKQYALQSAYTHSDSLSLAQIEQNENTDQSTIFINTYLVNTMAILGKVIQDFAQLFPEAKKIYQNDKSMYMLVMMVTGSIKA